MLETFSLFHAQQFYFLLSTLCTPNFSANNRYMAANGYRYYKSILQENKNFYQLGKVVKSISNASINFSLIQLLSWVQISNKLDCRWKISEIFLLSMGIEQMQRIFERHDGCKQFWYQFVFSLKLLIQAI